jgi:hypothetical protein
MVSHPGVIAVVGGGEPTPEQTAALVAVLLANGGSVEPPGPVRLGGWADPAASLRSPLTAGVGSWQAWGRVQGTRTGA